MDWNLRRKLSRKKQLKLRILIKTSNLSAAFFLNCKRIYAEKRYTDFSGHRYMYPDVCTTQWFLFTIIWESILIKWISFFNEGSKERFWEAKSMPLDYVESSVPSNSLRNHGYSLLSQRTLNHSWSMQFSWYLNTKCYSEVLVLIVNKQKNYVQLSEYRCRYM